MSNVPALQHRTFGSSLVRCMLAAAVATVLGLVLTACSGKAADPSCTEGPVVLTSACPSADSILGDDAISPPYHEANITMRDTSGQMYNIETENPGKTVLLYVGYTHWAFLCPTIMADTASALRQVGPEVRKQFQIVFITADPVRDTPTVLRKWLNKFSPSIVGLRAPIHPLIAAQKAMHVPISHIEHGKGKYKVQHSAELLVLTPDHENHLVFTYGPDLESDLQHDLPLIAANKAWQ